MEIDRLLGYVGGDMRGTKSQGTDVIKFSKNPLCMLQAGFRIRGRLPPFARSPVHWSKHFPSRFPPSAFSGLLVLAFSVPPVSVFWFDREPTGGRGEEGGNRSEQTRTFWAFGAFGWALQGSPDPRKILNGPAPD